jgi:hypothetical protein
VRLWILLLTACTGRAGGAHEGSDADSAPQGCGEYGIRYEGPDPPHVGDEWELWMTCDGVDTGVMLLIIYPGELGSWDGRVITFLEAGSGKIRLQTGVHRATMDVTILP